MPDRLFGRVVLPKTLVYDDGLTTVDIRVFVSLLDLRNSDGTIDTCLDDLAKIVDVSKFTICDSLKRLVDGNFITKKRRSRAPLLLTVKPEVVREVAGV